MRRWLFFVYGVSAHAVFLPAVRLHGRASFGGLFGAEIDRHAGPRASIARRSIVVDVLTATSRLALQHSVMARHGLRIYGHALFRR